MSTPPPLTPLTHTPHAHPSHTPRCKGMKRIHSLPKGKPRAPQGPPIHAPPLPLRAWCTQCLPGRCKPDVLGPCVVGMRWSMLLRTTAMHDASITPPRWKLRHKKKGLKAVIYVQECTHKVRKSAPQAALSKMQLTLHVRLAEHLTENRAWCRRCLSGR